ncbi:MAG: hypothetical protein ACK5OB_12915, partial [Pirellula sp.]
LRTIARIELGWIYQRGKRESVSNEHYEKAIREWSTMEPDKQKLIRDALPARVRTDWENVDYLHQEEVAPPVDSNAGWRRSSQSLTARGIVFGASTVVDWLGRFSDNDKGLSVGRQMARDWSQANAAVPTQREGRG